LRLCEAFDKPAPTRPPQTLNPKLQTPNHLFLPYTRSTIIVVKYLLNGMDDELSIKQLRLFV
jgi:hypothetical protein